MNYILFPPTIGRGTLRHRFMECSPGEFELLITSAARGGGMDWGLAEEAGIAARWLIARGLSPSFSDIFNRHQTLSFAEENKVGELVPRTAGTLLCPVAAGTYISDMRKVRTEWTFAQTAHPLIILPFASRIAADKCVKIQWADAEIITDGDNFVAQGDIHAASGEISIVAAAKPSQFSSPAERCEVADDEWQRLYSLAARSWVPATARSREVGAGAGTNDND